MSQTHATGFLTQPNERALVLKGYFMQIFVNYSIGCFLCHPVTLWNHNRIVTSISHSLQFSETLIFLHSKQNKNIHIYLKKTLVSEESQDT